MVIFFSTEATLNFPVRFAVVKTTTNIRSFPRLPLAFLDREAPPKTPRPRRRGMSPRSSTWWSRATRTPRGATGRASWTFSSPAWDTLSVREHGRCRAMLSRVGSYTQRFHVIKKYIFFYMAVVAHPLVENTCFFQDNN